MPSRLGVEAVVMDGLDAVLVGEAAAKAELGWELRYPSWREGFKEKPA